MSLAAFAQLVLVLGVIGAVVYFVYRQMKRDGDVN